MLCRCTAALTLLAMLSAASFAPGQDAGALVREGKHFRIVFHGGDLGGELAAKLADSCLTTAEAFWPILDKLLPVRAPKPGTIHVYRSEKEFRVAEQQNALRFRCEAFTTKALEGHVWLGPELSAEILQELGVPQAARDGLRFVAAEQVITPLVPATDEDGWLRCVAVMGAVEAASNGKHVPGADAGHDQRRVPFDAQRRSSSPYRLAQLLNPKRPETRNDQDFVLSCCSVVAQQLAAADASWAKKLLGKQRETKELLSAAARRKIAVESVLGADWAKTEAQFAKLGKTIRPVWRIANPLWQIEAQRSVLVGTSKTRAEIVAIEPPPGGNYVISGRAELGAGDPRGGFVVTFGLDEKTKSTVGVEVEPEELRVSEWRPEKGAFEARADAKVQLAATPFDFRIEVTEAEVRVSIDDLHLLTWAHGGRETHASWGLLARDRLVRFERLQVEPLKAQKK